MKLYLIKSPAHNFGTVDEPDNVASKTRYEGTQADARKTRIEFEAPFKEIKANKRPRVEVEEVEVPTSKAELLKWLNENAV